MKSKIFILLGLCFLIFSCETESLEFEEVATHEATLLSSSLSSNATSDCTPDLASLESSLPDTVTVNTKQSPCIEGDGSFITVDIPNGYLAGLDNPAWCADLDGSIAFNRTYTYDVYSSYEDLSGLLDSNGGPLFENPDNFDKINWILNQSFIGMESPLGGTYTFGHVQWAIWQLIEGNGNNCTDDCDYLSCNPINQWDNDKVYNESLGEEIVAAAAAGDGFVPQCGQQIAIVLASKTTQSLIITKEVPPLTPLSCETAFAKGNSITDSTCFIDNGFDRWGWTIGPLSEGEYTYNVYAGAGQCDINKGELAGTVTINYNSGDVSFSYEIDDAFTVTETHNYAGTNAYPQKKGKNTVAPGQYYIEENLIGDIYVIAHTVVCK